MGVLIAKFGSTAQSKWWQAATEHNSGLKGVRSWVGVMCGVVCEGKSSLQGGPGGVHVMEKINAPAPRKKKVGEKMKKGKMGPPEPQKRMQEVTTRPADWLNKSVAKYRRISRSISNRARERERRRADRGM